MPQDASQDEWVARVLGIRRGAAPPVGAARRWQAAKETVDTQLRSLAELLRKSGVPELAAVAGEVERVTEGVRVGLMAALLDHDAAPADPARRAAARDAVAAALGWLGSSERVREADNNPFGVTVTAAVTLGAALRQLQRDLAASESAAA